MYQPCHRYRIRHLPPNWRQRVCPAIGAVHFRTRSFPSSLFDSNAILYLNGPQIPKVTEQSADKSVSSLTTPTTVTEEIVRIDHKVNDKWQILGHYLHDAQATGSPYADLLELGIV
jgi:hypothetical protein